MPTFAEAVQKVDETGLPVVEGFAVELADGASPAAAAALIQKRFPAFTWTSDPMADGWYVVRGSSPARATPPLGEAWETVRALKALPGVRNAEPLLLSRVPVTNGSDAQRAFRLWGRVSDERLAQIRQASGEPRRHWSLEQMGVCDAPGRQGAWSIWKERRGNGRPGEGILVAHPDTGYTKHKRLLQHLQPQPGTTTRFGRNFVERSEPDGLDPMRDRSLGSFPGHGTGTASVIAAGHENEDRQPWGVAPGAKVLPLRVSSSVIHLSFQNLCDAFVEAMARNAHVISMSLGGPLGSALLNSLVRKALDRGIIVVSAAGNYAPTVVFPARIPGVLACAASNALKRPWRFSGLGAEVAVTAPGELVWHDRARIDANGKPVDDQVNGSGTSFATANVAGLAALWLSYHGRDELIRHCDDRPELLPFLFRLCLERSADPEPEFIREGRGGFGTGIARADELLRAELPGAAEVAAVRAEILDRHRDRLIAFPASSWWTIATLPTLTEGGPVLADSRTAQDKRERRLERFLTSAEGLAATLDDDDRAEIGALAAADAGLANGLARAVQGSRDCISVAAFRRYLLRSEALLSAPLRKKLEAAQDAARREWCRKHPELSPATKLPTPEDEEQIAYGIAQPPTRRLRAFAFDPSLATRSADAAVNEIIIPVVFERDLTPGPVGDYLEVVDVDPASDCAYAPVDLNHPFLLAQDGLPRSEGNPQFHQQMVYAVAMKTISHFEEALGRPIFWAPLRPWDERSGDEDRAAPSKDKDGAPDRRDQFVRRLRLHPHALRDQNAYYSPQKRAILFGYFPAGDSDPGAEYPGGVVFTCLAHDIIAHETTHAILDGMHIRFAEPTNPDVLAFHEAFADVVALFQRFTYPELLRDQIAKARGRLDAGTLMTRLALQFGQATGRHHALRDALGVVIEQARQKGTADWRDLAEEGEMDGGGGPRVTLSDAARDRRDEERRYLWKRFQADPLLLAQVEEPHERGSFLVAAVFDAYLRIYEDRVADLKRIATGGTGVLPEGDLHPDLVGRMANEAAKSAGHVLRMCIRAMDYVPPTDITFGEFLRALITADVDLVPDDDRRYRVAFIEAFRKWGIYPRDVRTLSEETLRWTPPEPQRRSRFKTDEGSSRVINMVRRALFAWQPGEPRENIFNAIHDAQEKLHEFFESMPEGRTKDAILGGINTRRSFQVTNLRPARRIGPRGEFRTEMVVEILQTRKATSADEEADERLDIPFRGGVTLIVGMDQENNYVVRYAIHKRPDSVSREARQREFLLRAAGGGSPEAAEYSSQNLPAGWFTREEERERWFKDRTNDLEAMRASSCSCRRQKMEEAAEKAAEKVAEKAAKKGGMPVPNPLNEPFALLHRGGARRKETSHV
jgi:subtilisin family serine protease